MSYQERIKSFDRIRGYVRDFFVYGYKVRNEYDEKSSRSYDDERKHIESWLGEYLKCRYEADGKINYLSVDSRSIAQNPLYRAFKTSSFTDADISLHFALMSVFLDGKRLTVQDTVVAVDEFLANFENELVLDQSTIRKKLNEYEAIGLLTKEIIGRKLYYRKADDISTEGMADAVSFFTEAAPCGVIGSYIQDCRHLSVPDSPFRFKQDYFASALDSEVTCRLFAAIHAGNQVVLEKLQPVKRKRNKLFVLPLQIVTNAETGRDYLLAFDTVNGTYQSCRIDYILSVNEAERSPEFSYHRQQLKRLREHMWGVELNNNPDSYEHVEVLFYVGPDEPHILRRLMREKSCGDIEQVDDTTWRFTADVTNTAEMLPWLRTYMGRIVNVTMSNEGVRKTFEADLRAMAEQYGLTGGEAE